MGDKASKKEIPAKPAVEPMVTTTTTTTQPQKKKNNTVLIVIIILLVLCLCCGVISAAAWFFSRRASDLANAALTAATNQVANELNNSTSSGSTSGSTSSGTTSGDSSNSNYTFSGDLPTGFPSDVPIYNGSKVAFSSTDTKSSNGKTEYYVTMTSSASTSDIVKYYKSALVSNGWKITGEQNFLGSSITAEKDDREFTVVVFGTNTNGENVSSITLSLTYK